MLLYCIITWLLALGVIIADKKYWSETEMLDLIFIIIAPIFMPVFIGMQIGKK